VRRSAALRLNTKCVGRGFCHNRPVCWHGNVDHKQLHTSCWKIFITQECAVPNQKPRRGHFIAMAVIFLWCCCAAIASSAPRRPASAWIGSTFDSTGPEVWRPLHVADVYLQLVSAATEGKLSQCDKQKTVGSGMQIETWGLRLIFCVISFSEREKSPGYSESKELAVLKDCSAHRQPA